MDPVATSTAAVMVDTLALIVPLRYLMMVVGTVGTVISLILEILLRRGRRRNERMSPVQVSNLVVLVICVVLAACGSGLYLLVEAAGGR